LVSAKVPKAICACAIARKRQRVPCTPRRLRGSGQGTFPVPGSDARLAALRSPCSCLQARGSLSVASPFSGAIPALRPPCRAWAPAQAVPGLGVRRDERPPDPRLYPAHPPDLCLDPLHPSRARSGPTSLSSLHCPASLESPGFAFLRCAPALRCPCFACVPARAIRGSGVRRDNSRLDCCLFPAQRAALGRPGQTLRGLPVRRAKGPLDPWQVSGSPMGSPLAGAAIHWIAAFYPARPSALARRKAPENLQQMSFLCVLCVFSRT
jgi:hypothetical protein